jgi:RNA polymerase sigma-70 factor, ECF subfamily
LKQRTNQEWVDDLLEPNSNNALEDLRKILLNGLRASLSGKIDTDFESITEDFAQDALLKILKNIHTFRGESKFTTWGQKIAINVAFSELRRKRWKNVSLQKIIETADGDEYTPVILADDSDGPEDEVTQAEILNIVYELINTELTEKQKQAIIAVMEGGMPLEEVANRMGTNRNALYKLIYDARKRLQEKLFEKVGVSFEEIMSAFS